MPSLPDIPGKSLVTGTGRRTSKAAVGAGLAVIAVGGYALRRIVRRLGGGEDGGAASTDPISETPTAPPGAEEKDPPKASPPKPAPPEPEEPASEAQAEPPTTTGTDAPPKPEVEPGDISKDRDPHHALNNPVEDPDPTEWPDPYEKREDPRDPADPDGQPFGEEPHAPTNAESTSEPHPGEDPEAGDREARAKERDKLDD